MLAARGSGPGAIPCGGRAGGEGAAPPGAAPPPALTPCRLTESVFQGRYGESDSGARRLGQRHHQAAAAATAAGAEWLYGEVVGQ